MHRVKIKKDQNKTKSLRVKKNDLISKFGIVKNESEQGPPSDAYELLGEASEERCLSSYGWLVGYVRLAG